MPQFSIITITKNDPKGLEETAQSVSMQTYKDYEWIVIDGNVEPDNGIYDAMNKGIDRAKGDYLIFMNSGDVFATRDVLKIIANFCPADFIYGDAIEAGYLKPARHHSKIARGLFTHHQSMVYRRDVIGDRRYDENYKIAADYKFTIEHVKKSSVCHYVEKPFCIFGIGGVSQLRSKQGRAEQIQIRKELNISAPLTPFIQWVAQFLRGGAPSLYLYLRSTPRLRNKN